MGTVNESARVLCDWGNTRLRAFLEVGGVVSDRRDGPGVALSGGEPPASILASVLAPWRAGHRLDRVFLCGMAGSRNGLVEVPYVRTPAEVHAWRRGARRVLAGDIEASVAAGIETENFHGAPDVMRGEETQIFGALRLDRRLARGCRLIVLPGTHSKWVMVRDAHIARFQTCLTGELFDLLCRHSSLLRAGAGAGLEAGEEGFEAGLSAAARGERIASLFEARAAQLVGGRTSGWTRAFLSGLLIGAELTSMVRALKSAAGEVTLIGESALAAFYLRALTDRGITAHALDGDRCVLAGLHELAVADERS